MTNRFEGKVVVVTGASSGIGKVSALAFAGEGAKVIVAARRVERLVQTVEEIKAAGGEALFIQTDVSIEQDINGSFRRA